MMTQTSTRWLGLGLAAAFFLTSAPAFSVTNGDFGAGLTDWEIENSPATAATPGEVVAIDGAVELREGGAFLVSIKQSFVMPKDPIALSFDIIGLPVFDTAASFIPDAFEASLVTVTGSSAVVTHRLGATSYANRQEDGTETLATGVTTSANAGATTVTLDISTVAEGTPVTFVLSLVGGDSDTGSVIRIDNVVLDANPNTAPTAEAGDNGFFPCGLIQPLVLDGSASSDPDEGDVLSYSWSNEGSVVGTDPQLSIMPGFGIHTYTLTVTDLEGASDSDDVIIEVGELNGDVNADGTINVQDVQCLVIGSLWQLAGSVGDPPGCLAGDDPLIGDLDCTDTITVIDTQISIFLALAIPLSTALDANQDGCPDTCPVQSLLD